MTLQNLILFIYLFIFTNITYTNLIPTATVNMSTSSLTPFASMSPSLSADNSTSSMTSPFLRPDITNNLGRYINLILIY